MTDKDKLLEQMTEALLEISEAPHTDHYPCRGWCAACTADEALAAYRQQGNGEATRPAAEGGVDG